MIENTQMNNRIKYLEILKLQMDVFEPILNPLYEDKRRILTEEEEKSIEGIILLISSKMNNIERDISLKEINKEKENLELLVEKYDSTKFFTNVVSLNFKIRN